VTSSERSATVAISSSCGSIERDLHSSPLPLHRRVQRLADPPYGVADEVHADIGIVLVRRADETSIGLAHQVAERYPAILVLLGNRKREPEVGANELGPGSFPHIIARGAAHLARKILLLQRRQNRLPTQLIDVQIQQIAVVVCRVHRSPPALEAPDLVFQNSTIDCRA
jgi:hypothetical protein